jgi:hypothetical protein
MTAMGSIRDTLPGRRDNRTVLKATLAAGVSGCAMGLWQAGLPDSRLLLPGAAVAAVFALYWTIAAMRKRELSVTNAATNLRAAVAALPTWTRPLLLAAPASRTARQSEAARRIKPAASKRAPENPPTSSSEPPRGSIEAERARLKALGYGDPEISQILVTQATENGAARGSGFGSGAASGLLNNVDAVLHYLKGLVPSFRSDFERMFDESASKADRASGAVSLVLKAAAIGVVGYYLWIESIAFRGHALEAWGKGCLAAQDNAIKHATLNQLFAGGHLAGDVCDPRPQ